MHKPEVKETVKAERQTDLSKPYVFSTQKDLGGWLVESPEYAKASCKDCYGRGHVIQCVPVRHYQTCHCVKRGYFRTLDAAVKQVVAQDDLVTGIVQTRQKDLLDSL